MDAMMKELPRRWMMVGVGVLSLVGFGEAKEKEDLWTGLIREVRASVVEVSVTRSIALVGDARGNWTGTGFIADLERGWVVTNQHIVGRSPYSSLEITFFNGDAADSKVLYYDPWHDFAILQFDPSALAKGSDQPAEARLGTHDELEVGETVLLMGNSSGEGLSAKLGRVNHLFVDKAPNSLGRHSHHFHLSLARNGGSSGSPVFNRHGRVVGLHTSGVGDESFELRIDYVVDALLSLREGQNPRRGDLGIVLDAAARSAVVWYLDFGPEVIEAVRRMNPELHHLLVVKKRLPGSAAYEKLRPGDVVVGLKGQAEAETVLIGGDVYGFDRIVNENVGEAIVMDVLRDGRKLTVELPVVDAESQKIRRFAVFAGATFHEVPADTALQLNFGWEGVFLSEAEPGTTFSALGLEDGEEGQRLVVVSKIGKTKIENLEDFLMVVSPLRTGDGMAIWFRDLNSIYTNEDVSFVDVDARFSPLSNFVLNEERLEWVKTELQR
jgi:S1-C subfamily serine protease